MPRFKLLFLCVSAIIILGCKDEPEISISKISLLESPKEYLSDNPVVARGIIEVVISSSSNIILPAKEDDLNIWVDAHGCETKISIESWPYIYQGEQQDKFIFLLNYKNMSRSNPKYSIFDYQENICVKIKYGSMNPLKSYSLKSIEINLNKEIRDQIEMYDRQNMPVFYKN